MDILDVTPTETKSEPFALRAMAEDPALDEALPPPQRGLPLGAVLGVTISLLVALLLGGMTTLQLHREEHREIAARQGLLAESLAPLSSEMEGAADIGEIERLLSSCRRAEAARGRRDYNVMLRDGDGRVVASAIEGDGTSPAPDSIQAKVSVRSPLLASGHGTLTAWQNDSGLAAEMESRRHAARIDIAAAVLAVILVVQLTIFLLVTRPMNRLLANIDKVEQGYPARLRQGDIARELRWLEWRFHRMSASLTNSARLLVAAHRRAMEAAKSRRRSDIDPRLLDPLDLGRNGRPAGHDIMRRYLRDRCALLEGRRRDESAAWEIARQVWERDAVEAERFGEMDLRARLENTALTVLDPEAIERVSRELDALIEDRDEWCTATAEAIEAGLAADRVPLVGIQRRTKHAAGVWRKMQEKGLALEEVHDLLAFRIVVPSQDDCYLALDTVHRLFEPEPFRFKDYIVAPKANGYQSLHTSVRDRDGFVFEVQIRTVDMHRAAENGDAAHWRYRAGKSARLSPRSTRAARRPL